MRSPQSDASGFIMVVLLIVMGIGAVWMAAALPSWRQQATREKEAELAFRGQQYVHALALYQRKNGPGTRPPNLDVLVDNKFLRKKYKDPITNDDFVPLYASTAPVVPGQPAGGGQGPGQGRAGAPAGGFGSPSPGRAGQPGPGAAQPTGQGGGTTFGGVIVGVASKSTAASIRLYNGASHYNEWQFVLVNQPQAGGPGGRSGPGGPGGRPTGPGGFGPGIGGPGGQRPGGPGGQRPGGPGRGGTPTGPGRGRGGE